MRPATFEEREHLCRLAQKFGAEEVTDFLGVVEKSCRYEHESQSTFLSMLFNGPGVTDLPEEKLLEARTMYAEAGKEYTPQEIREVVECRMQEIRMIALQEGIRLPESDFELVCRYAQAKKELANE